MRLVFVRVLDNQCGCSEGNHDHGQHNGRYQYGVVSEIGKPKTSGFPLNVLQHHPTIKQNELPRFKGNQNCLTELDRNQTEAATTCFSVEAVIYTIIQLGDPGKYSCPCQTVMVLTYRSVSRPRSPVMVLSGNGHQCNTVLSFWGLPCFLVFRKLGHPFLRGPLTHRAPHIGIFPGNRSQRWPAPLVSSGSFQPSKTATQLHGCCWETFFPFFAHCGLVVQIQPLNC